MGFKRKFQLVLLFSLSLSVVGTTLYRVPHIVDARGRQQYRSLMASIEILFATASANALVLGSFVRDRGLKKHKFRRTSLADSFDPASSSRRPTLNRHWGSDEDLVRDVGISVDPELRDQPTALGVENGPHFTPAPVAIHFGDDVNQWQFPKRHRSTAEHSDDSLLVHNQTMRGGSDSPATGRRVSFFDVGGLLDDAAASSSGSYGPNGYNSSNADSTQSYSLPSATLPAGTKGFRRGSTALLQDLGGLLVPLNSRPSRSKSKTGMELQTIAQSPNEHTPNNHGGHQEPVLMDPGGLLT